MTGADVPRRCPAPIVGATHVIDDGGQPDLAQFRLDREEVVVEAEHLDEPAELANPVKRVAQGVETRRQLEVAAEIEARSAHADAVQPSKLGVADTVVDDGDATIFSLRRGLEHVVQQGVVGAVDGRLHQHRAVDAHGIVQRLHRREVAVLRRLIERVRIADRIGPGIAEDMQMRIATVFRQAFRHGNLLLQ